MGDRIGRVPYRLGRVERAVNPAPLIEPSLRDQSVAADGIITRSPHQDAAAIGWGVVYRLPVHR